MGTRLVVALLALFITIYILPLGLRPLTQRDECRYAEIPREMLASGDWIVPHLDGLRYFEKPVLGYWLIALSMRVLGGSNFAVRLPAALAAGAAALAVFLLVRRHEWAQVPAAEAARPVRPGLTGKRPAANTTSVSSGPPAAALAAGVLLTSGQFAVLGNACVLDMPVTFWLTAALALFFCAFTEERRARRAFFLAACGACGGGAFLTKGFLALVVPAVAVVPFLAWQRQLRRLPALAWLPLAVAAAVSAPWAIAVHLREPDYWRYFFWVEHVQRFLSPEAQHPQPFWFFIPVILVGALPWTGLAPAAAIGLRRRGGADPLVRLCLCWLVFPFLFFSVSRGKLGTYILPCFPPLAVLVSLGLLRYIDEGVRKALAWGTRLPLVLLLGAGAAVAAWQLSGLGSPPYARDEFWKWALPLAALAAWAALSEWRRAAGGPRGRLAGFCAGAALFLAAAHLLSPRGVEEGYTSVDFVTRHLARVKPSDPLCCHNTMVNAVCWYSKRSDVYLFGDPGELEYGLSYPDARQRGIRKASFPAFLALWPRDTLVAVLTSSRGLPSEWQELPKPEFEEEEDGRAFAQYRGGPAPGAP